MDRSKDTQEVCTSSGETVFGYARVRNEKAKAGELRSFIYFSRILVLNFLGVVSITCIKEDAIAYLLCYIPGNK